MCFNELIKNLISSTNWVQNNGNPMKTIIEIASKQKPHIIIDKLLLDILLSYLSTISLNKYAINIPKIKSIIMAFFEKIHINHPSKLSNIYYLLISLKCFVLWINYMPLLDIRSILYLQPFLLLICFLSCNFQ